MTSLPYYNDYRTRQHTLDNIGWTRTKHITLAVSHNDLIRLFACSAMLSASWSHTDHYTEYTYGQDFTTAKAVWGDTRRRTLTALTSVDKTLIGMGLGTKATLTYNRSEALAAQNGLRRIVKANVTSAAINLNWNKLAWLSLSDALTCNINWQDKDGENNSHNTLRSIFNTATAHLYPSRNISTSLSWELARVELSQGCYAVNNFVDATLRWTAHKNIELSVSINNLLDRTRYEEASYDGLNYSFYAVPLRGREFLFSAAMKF